MNRFIQINEQGQFHFQGLVVKDKEVIFQLFQSMRFDDLNRLIVSYGDIYAFVEAYEAPLMVHRVDIENQKLILEGGFSESFCLEELKTDEWDRFCGFSQRGLPFVFLRKAQNLFFNELYSFDDTSIFVTRSKKIKVKKWFSKETSVSSSSFWTGIYQKDKSVPWDLAKPSPVLKKFWPRLKMIKSRILVSGCGKGYDAHFLATQGHHVTALDFSKEALRKAQSLHNSKYISWVKKDIFDYDLKEEFDVIFDHNLFCAIDPLKRDDLVQKYRSLLDERGLFIGIFFIKKEFCGPPYGASEWELHCRLEKRFRFLHWFRCRQSVEKRLGSELFISALKV